MPIMLTVRELWPLREYTWSREKSRSGFAKVDGKSVQLSGPMKWDALVEDMKKRGWDSNDPLILDIGAKGGVKVGEGNHRLAIARELGMSRVPVQFRFVPYKVTKSLQNQEVVEVRKPSVKKVVERMKREQPKLSPGEQARKDEQVEEIMNLLGF